MSDLRLEVHVYRSSGRAALDQFAASTGGESAVSHFAPCRNELTLLPGDLFSFSLLSSADDDDDNEPGVMAATVRDLPSRELDGLWDT